MIGPRKRSRWTSRREEKKDDHIELNKGRSTYAAQFDE